MNKLLEKLKSINNVSVSINNTEIIVANSNKYKARLIFEDIANYQYITSPFNEECLKIDFDDENFIVITPDDFVFNTINGKYMKVSNLPPMISINEMLDRINMYIKNPEPTNNIDNTIALYLLNRLSLLSAKNKKFEVDDLLLKIKETAQNTSEGDDIIASEKYI